MQRNGGGGRPQPNYRAPEDVAEAESDCEQDAAAAVDPAAVVARVDSHMLPWLFAIGMLCYLDRTNLSFAALELNRDLGLSCADYGLGAGLFFATYAVFQVPSNLLCVRLGAPTWLGLTVAAWGCVAAGFSLVRSRAAFLALRLVLGLAECGAFPGIWYHCSLFYSQSELGQAYSKAAASGAVAQVIGAPLAAGLLSLDGVGGMRGWQWLFLLEGLPTIAFGLALRARLAPSPERAKFLSRAERRWLVRRQEAAAVKSSGSSNANVGAPGLRAQLSSLAGVFQDWRIIYLGCSWLFIAATMYGLIFWSPLLIASMLDGNATGGGSACDGGGHGGASASSQSSAVVALLSAVPFAAAAAGMVVNARLSDLANERHRHAGVPILLGGLALGAVPMAAGAGQMVAAFCFLVLAAGLVWSFHGPFMSWPSVLLPPGAQAAAGFAFINTFGSVGGFLGPYAIGLLAGSPSGGAGGYGTAMAALACCLMASGTAILLFPAPGSSPPPLKEGHLPVGRPTGSPAALNIVALAASVEEELPILGAGSARVQPSGTVPKL